MKFVSENNENKEVKGEMVTRISPFRTIFSMHFSFAALEESSTSGGQHRLRSDLRSTTSAACF